LFVLILWLYILKELSILSCIFIYIFKSVASPGNNPNVNISSGGSQPRSSKQESQHRPDSQQSRNESQTRFNLTSSSLNKRQQQQQPPLHLQQYQHRSSSPLPYNYPSSPPLSPIGGYLINTGDSKNTSRSGGGGNNSGGGGAGGGEGKKGSVDGGNNNTVLTVNVNTKNDSVMSVYLSNGNLSVNLNYLTAYSISPDSQLSTIFNNLSSMNLASLTNPSLAPSTSSTTTTTSSLTSSSISSSTPPVLSSYSRPDFRLTLMLLKGIAEDDIIDIAMQEEEVSLLLVICGV
jgi:hypothetical protein